MANTPIAGPEPALVDWNGSLSFLDSIGDWSGSRKGSPEVCYDPPVHETPSPIWIDRPARVPELAARCTGVGACALDTEADSLHSYFHKVCLLQVSVDGRHYVLDPLALGAGGLAPLFGVLADPGVTVLMHGADYDLRVLDRDYGARIAALQDTQVMAQLLGEPKTGLAALLAAELGVELDKRHQRADWGRRPLSSSMLAYAACDTAYLDALADRLRTRLTELGRWPWAEEEFRRLERVRHVPQAEDPLAFERIKGARALRGEARDRLFSLHRWRESIARQRDVPPFKVIGNREILALATAPPGDLQALGGVSGVGPRLVRRWGRELLAMLTQPGPAPALVRSQRPEPPPPAVRRRVTRLLAARDAVAGQLGIEPGLLCPRSVVEAIADRSGEGRLTGELERGGLEGWRLDVLREAFAVALNE